ncbi:MAG: phage virion morphogenesis protein [Lysobacterales bacterium]
MKIEVAVLYPETQAMLSRMERLGVDLRPLMQEIGEQLTESTKQRFATGTAPDGTQWAPNAQSTYLTYLAKFRGSLGKNGRLTRAGIGRVTSKRPLVGESRRLSSEIYYRATRNSVDVGSAVEYAAAQHFGNPTNRFFGKALAPIPARPFVGLSDQDQVMLVTTAGRFLQNALRGASSP